MVNSQTGTSIRLRFNSAFEMLDVVQVVSDQMGNWLKCFATVAVLVTLVYGRPYAGDRDMLLGGELFTLSLFALRVSALKAGLDTLTQRLVLRVPRAFVVSQVA